MWPMRLLREYRENLDIKHHGVHRACMRARSAEWAAERSFAFNPLLIISAAAALVTMLFVPPFSAMFKQLGSLAQTAFFLKTRRPAGEAIPAGPKEGKGGRFSGLIPRPCPD